MYDSKERLNQKKNDFVEIFKLSLKTSWPIPITYNILNKIVKLRSGH